VSKFVILPVPDKLSAHLGEYVRIVRTVSRHFKLVKLGRLLAQFKPQRPHLPPHAPLLAEGNAALLPPGDTKIPSRKAEDLLANAG
jgi:hypothetical protein